MKHPSQFLYGAATSAHQVEGNNIHNDWWEWEKRAGKVRSGRAADHYHRYTEDFALAKSLSHNAHRLSLEWSRIELAPGQWHRPAINHYRAVLEELKQHNMKTFVTLHHFTNPLWLARQGGWLSGETPELFEQYVRYVAQHLGDLVDFWITINEPVVYANQAYWKKVWPPQHKSLSEVWRVIRHLARAHRRAYRVLHTITPHTPVGIAKHMIAYLPDHADHFGDRFAAAVEDWWFNHRFYRLTGHSTHDFLGINYYFTTKQRVQLFPLELTDVPWDGPKSDMDWPIRPEGLIHVLRHMKRYGKPIYITENGLADAEDKQRAAFIRSHLRAVEEAQAQGVDVRGYLHWSLLDNFEWADGFTPRFGLIEVDRATLERKVRSSAYVYKAIIDQARSKY